MMGRFYQEHLGQKPQVIITSKITPGLDGKAKQSKSLGNYIALEHSPRDKFGRTMTLPDSLIVSYLEVYTDVSLEEIAEIAQRVQQEPMQCKLFLAHEIVRRYHGLEAADQEQEWFVQTFSTRQTPLDIPELGVKAGEQTVLELLRLFFGPGKSLSELRRLCSQGAVTYNGQALRQPAQTLEPRTGDVFRVGKRAWFRVRIDG